jgi:hypothetical protein
MMIKMRMMMKTRTKKVKMRNKMLRKKAQLMTKHSKT